MANPYYVYSGSIIAGAAARAEQVAAELNNVTTGFNLLAIQGTDTGSANLYVVATQGGQPTTVLADGNQVAFKAANTNSMSSTLQVNGGPVTSVLRFNGSALQPGDIQAGAFYTLTYNATYSAWTLPGTIAITFSGTISNAAPVNKVGLSAVAGVSSAATPIDATYALDQTISPAWAGNHKFAGTNTSSGPFAFTGPTTISGALTVSGTSTVSGPLALAGALIVTGTASANGPWTLSGPLTVSGTASFSGPLTVSGVTTHSAALTVSGTASFSGPLTVSSTTTHSGALTVSGTASFSGPLTVSSTTTHSGALTVSGTASFSGPLTVSGTASFNIVTGVCKFGTAFQVGTAAPWVQGYGPTKGGLVDLTPDTGSFVMTYTGFTANPSGSAAWARIGNLVILFMPAGAGTSNATSFTATGLPAAIQPGRTQWLPIAGGAVQDASSPAYQTAVQVTASSGTMTFYVAENATGWTNTGTKGVAYGFTVSYLLN